MVTNYTTAANGNWSGSAWSGGVKPTFVAGDTVSIAHNVVMDSTNPTNGVILGTTTLSANKTLTIAAVMAGAGSFGNIVIPATATLYASRSVSNLLIVAGTITSSEVAPAGINYGTFADPISNNAIGAFIHFVCTSDNQSSRGIVCSVDNACTFYGAARTIQTTLASIAALNDSTIVLADDLALRPTTGGNPWDGVADMIVVGQEPTLGVGVGAENYHIENYAVAGYVAGTKTVTLGDAGAGSSDWARAATPYNQIKKVARPIGTIVYVMSYNVGVRGSAYNLRPTRGIDCGNHSQSIINTSVWWCAYGIIYNYGTCTTCNSVGCTDGIYNNYGTCTTCNSVGCTYGIIYNYGTCTTCNSVGCTYGIGYNSGGTNINCDLSVGNTNGIGYSQWGEFRNCKYPSSENNSYNSAYYHRPWQYMSSWDHNQVPGAFKSWVLGGIVTKATNVMPTGATYSYEHACESAIYPCFRQLVYTMKRYEKLHYRTWVRKTVTMTYLPRIQIIDFFADPLVSTGVDVNGVLLYANAALAETLMSNSVDTWEQIDVYYPNNSDMPKKVILRTLAMNASGIVYFYPSVIKNEDNIVCCDSEGAV